MAEMNIQQAISALSQMSAFGNAIQNAHIVLAALENAEAVGKSLAVNIATQNEELQQAQERLVATKSTAETLMAHAQATVADAEQRAKDCLEAAAQQVAEVNDVGAAAAAQAREALAALQTQIDAAQTELVARHADLDKVNADIAAAKNAAKIMLADHA